MKPRDGIIVLLGSLLCACSLIGDESETYELSASDVHRKIMATELPLPFKGSAAFTLKTHELNDGAIQLSLVNTRSAEAMNFVADIDEAGPDRTRVLVRYDGGSKDKATLDASSPKHPEIEDVYVDAMREQIDAELENRPFNGRAMMASMLKAGIANKATIDKSVTQAAEAARERNRLNIENAYKNEHDSEW